MPEISVTDARPLFTKDLVDVYRQISEPTAFLRSFFKETYSGTKLVSVEVQRGFEMIAVDVLRGTEGNRNRFSSSTERMYLPPLYDEYFDLTELDLYDRLFGSTQITGSDYANFLYSVAMKVKELENKIARRYELQCAQVLQTGVVQLVNGTNIDFKRKAASLVDPGAGNYWANASLSGGLPTGINPYTQLETGCNFLRQVGKAKGGMFNMILGSKALTDLQTNPFFLQKQNLFNMALDSVNAPQRNSVGAAFHGILTVGSYKVLIWTYPQFYDIPASPGVAAVLQTPYIDPNTAILIDEAPEFILSYAAVPQLLNLNGGGVTPFVGPYMVSEWMDQRLAKHDIIVKSAAIAIPTAVDKIYTLKTGV